MALPNVTSNRYPTARSAKSVSITKSTPACPMNFKMKIKTHPRIVKFPQNTPADSQSRGEERKNTGATMDPLLHEQPSDTSHVNARHTLKFDIA